MVHDTKTSLSKNREYLSTGRPDRAADIRHSAPHRLLQFFHVISLTRILACAPKMPDEPSEHRN